MFPYPGHNFDTGTDPTGSAILMVWYRYRIFIAVTFPFQEPVLDPDFDWIALAKRKKLEALEDNRIRFER